MKTRLLRLLYGVSIFDLLLGLVVSIGALFTPVSTSARAGGGLLLVLGAFGCWWFGAALQRHRGEVTT